MKDRRLKIPQVTVLPSPLRRSPVPRVAILEQDKKVQRMNRHLVALRRLSQRALSPLVAGFALSLTSGMAMADDTEVYRALSGPKVLFVLDASGSMGWSDKGFSDSRMARMKRAMSQLLRELRGIDVGIMDFTSHRLRLLHPVADVESNQAALQTALANIRAGGGTPTVAALYEASQYMRGERPYRGKSPTGTSYTSPVKQECDSSHIVLLTDGVPAQRDDDIVNKVSPNYGPCGSTPDVGGTCGAELAGGLANTDQRADLPGENIITTHAIGFNLRSDWLKGLASAGGGVYRDAESSQDLLVAFDGILNSVAFSSAASAPSISVNSFNESRHQDELYYAFYQPYRKPRWDGNVKKYRIRDGEIVDADNNPLLDADGVVAESSRSLWSKTADGESILAGGMAARQSAERKWYTDAPIGNSVSNNSPFLVTDASALAPNLFDVATAAERDRLVSWVRGVDSADADGDLNFTEPNRYVADSLHNSPILVSFAARESSSFRSEAIFTANNMGVVHAVDASSGDELWSYSPWELLPNVKAYVDNKSESHIYGLDGEILLHTERKAKSATSYDYEIEKAWMYLTQRRGGNSLFAMDITNAMSSTNPFKVMWKIHGGVDGTDFRDLGQTWAKPEMIPIRYGCPLSCTTRNVLMFGGGYNPIYDEKDLAFPVSAANTGHGNVIYLVDPETGELIWSAGKGKHHDLILPMNDSIPTTPIPVDIDADGGVDVLFGSDIAGNLWRIDFSKEAAEVKDLAIAGGKIAALNLPGETLRFFNRLDVVVSGLTEGTAAFSLVMGSGMRSSPTYNESEKNRLYVVKDAWVFSRPVGKTIDPATKLRKSEYRYVANENGKRSIIRPQNLWQYSATATASNGEREYGFFKVLSETGEKILQPTLTHSGQIFMVSFVPPDPTAVNTSCAFEIGESRLHVLDLNDGSNRLASRYGEHLRVGPGVVGNGSILDTGGKGGADFVIGLNSEKVDDLIDTSGSKMRRMVRTGWLEKQ
ncbi:hypothetical protein AB833_10105 [Chromatiales bacterium (ex Bugula neritina AB1)]|nr:hypothetical protein AB833_10105 [Chromatiales bacterium (ex Bugula neritina AB1)]